MKAGLYCIATPIGNLDDITLRAIETLKKCDVIACEDTRVSKRLLHHYGIDVPLMSYHDHNAETIRPKIIQQIQAGKVIGLISDAGTPLINDPGVKLVRQCIEHGLYVTTLPGPSAVTSALVLSGLMSDMFSFMGFFHKKNLPIAKTFPGTLIFFESAIRILETLDVMKDVLQLREVSVIREISKIFEECIKGDFHKVIEYFKKHPPKGEIVIVVGPQLEHTKVNTHDIQEELKVLLATSSLKDSVDTVSSMHPISKSEVYQLALELKKNDGQNN